LDKDLDTVNFPERVKVQQRNWIGKSEGAEIEFEVESQKSKIKIFTTRPDTIFGATFVAVSPEMSKKLTGKDFGIKTEENKPARLNGVSRSGGEKLGIDTGLKVKNPANGEMIPVWVVNYVSNDYGTGAIMGVPADDERDREFAEKYKLPIVENYKPAGFEDYGKRVTRFKLRDWIFSRQRYWGEPIPVIHCPKCGMVPVPEKDLPVLLPEVENYQPTDTGESPLATIEDWVNVKCPKCGEMAKRETDTMPNWAGSSWYFLRYTDPSNSKEFASRAKLDHWTPVDWYNGGMEHTTLHLLYSRFWNKFLFDLGLVPTSEPYLKRTSHGFILAENGEKMSKSRGNVVNPDAVVEQFGADTLRLYEMFMGPFEQAISWNEDSLVGPRRFLERVWKLSTSPRLLSSHPSPRARRGERGEVRDVSFALLNKTIKKVTDDIELMGFNTAVSALMIFVNDLEKQKEVSQNEFEILLKLLYPFAPHITEELWQDLGHEESIGLESWPEFDEEQIVSEETTIGVQINGKLRATLRIASDATEDDVRKATLALPELAKWLDGQTPKKVIVVLGRIVNIVV
jgi:leucyl-tRNA synthetase